MLCEKCQEREATVHMTRIINGVMTNSNLCTECTEASPAAHDREAAAWMRELATEAKTKNCKYCGDQPCVPSPDFTAIIAGEQRHTFLCVPCSKELQRLIQQELPNIDQSTSQQKDISAMFQKLQEVADKHMKQWVSQRGEQ